MGGEITNYTSVENLAYDGTNKKIMLKVEGADTPIPFSSGGIADVYGNTGNVSGSPFTFTINTKISLGLLYISTVRDGMYAPFTVTKSSGTFTLIRRLQAAFGNCYENVDIYKIENVNSGTTVTLSHPSYWQSFAVDVIKIS